MIRISKPEESSSVFSVSSIFNSSTNTYGEIRGIDWKRIIFIPFNTFWKILMITTVLISELQVIYYLAYERISLTTSETVAFYVMDCLYLVDTVLFLLHKIFARKRSLHSFLPKKKLLIAIDFISLTPIDSIYTYLVINKQMHWSQLENIFRCRILLRSYRLHVSLDFAYNQITQIHINHILCLLLTTHMLGGILHVINNYGHSTIKPKFLDKSSDNASLYLFYDLFVYKILQHSNCADYKFVTDLENVFLGLTLLLGFIFVVYLYGRLLPLNEYELKHQMDMRAHFHTIKQYLENWHNTPSRACKHIIDYYQSLWKYLHGLESPPHLFDKLPLSLRHELQTDMFWDAFKHSSLFVNVDMSLIRALSLKMVSEFLLPGDILYEPNCAKNRMVYIATGIVNILSPEDDTSPILSFSSGTCFGEMSLLIQIKSNVYCVCATYCQIYYLTAESFHRQLEYFPEYYVQLRKELKTRLINAQKMVQMQQNVKETRNIPVFIATLYKPPDVIWLKKRLRQLTKLNSEQNKSITKSILLENTVVEHRSDYLNSLALSEDVELKLQVIFLRSTFPFIFESNSNFMQKWKFFEILVIAFISLLYPYMILIQRKIISSTYLHITIFCDIVFISDIYLQCSTALKREGVVIITFCKIFTHRLKQISFLTDVFASLPLNYIQVIGVSDHLEVLLLSNRLLKSYKVYAFINKLQTAQMDLNNIKIGLYKYLISYVCILYWTCCVLYGYACFFEEDCYDDSWIFSDADLARKLKFKENKFQYTLLYITTFLIPGYSNLRPQKLYEEIFGAVFLTILAVLSLVFGTEYIALKALEIKQKINYYRFFNAIVRFVKKQKPPTDLVNDLVNFLNFQWEHNQGITLTTKITSIRYTTNHARVKPSFELFMECIKNIPLFQGGCREMLTQICNIGSVYYLPANIPIDKQNIHSTNISYIYEGFCEMNSNLPGDQIRGINSIVGPGTHFPIFALLYDVPVIVSVKTVTCCTIVTFDFNKVKKILKLYTKFNDELYKVVKESKSNIYTILLFKESQYVEMKVSGEKNIVPMKTFEYEHVKSTKRGQKQFFEGYKILSSLQIFKYCLLRRTFHPESRLILCWEIGRCIIIMLSILFWPHANGILHLHKIKGWQQMEIVIEVTSFLDIFIRLHIGYYNKKSIYVHHPAWTAVHYLKHSFAIDLFASLPLFHLLSMGYDQPFGFEYEDIFIGGMFTISRTLQLYRPLGLITYFQSFQNSTVLFNVYGFIKDFVVIVVIVNNIASFQILIECHENWKKSLKIRHCSAIFSDDQSTAYGYSIHFVISLITGVGTILYQIQTMRQVRSFLCQTLCFLYIKWLYFGQKVCLLVSGDANLTEFQNKMNQFKKFAENEIIFEDIIKNTMNHYTYTWNRTKGMNIRSTLKKLHLRLRDDIILFLYGSCFKNVKLFDSEDEKFLSDLGAKVQEVYYLENVDIIRTNDVQGKIYVILKGSVEVYIDPNIIVTHLTHGAMFGCFDATRKVRHRMGIRTCEKTDLLMISASEFFNLVETKPVMKQRMENVIMLRMEYIESKNKNVREHDLPMAHLSSHHKNRIKKYVYKCVSKRLKEDTKWFNFLTFIFEVIGPFLTCFFMPLHIVLHTQINIASMLKSIIYAIDVLYYLKIYVGFQTVYYDASHHAIIKFKKIFLHYTAHIQLFWIDLFTVFPFELFAYFLHHQEIFDHLNTYLKLNRLLRLYFFIRYFYRCKQNISISLRLQWMYIIIFFVLSIHFISCIWIGVNCHGTFCERTGYKRRIDMPKNNSILYTEGFLSVIITGYMYTIDRSSGTNLGQVAPRNLSEALLDSLLSIWLQICFLCVISGVIGIMLVKYKHFIYYLHSLKLLLYYYQDRKLSNVLIQKIKDYCEQLWKRQGDDTWLPALILEAPSYLQQDLMNDLYSHHLKNNLVFQNAHAHFLRQLVTRLKRCVYFPGDVIVLQGDVTHSMYFINMGQVNVIDKDYGDDDVQQTLLTNHQFGLLQGLYSLPFKKTYKARTIVDILILNRFKWIDLFEAFPASREVIIQNSVEPNIERNFVQRRSFRRKMSKHSEASFGSH